MHVRAILLLLTSLFALGCSSRADEGAVSIAVIGSQDAPFETGNRLSFAGQLVREATSESLVAMDAQGDVIPAIAERWTITDDGLSYFFRIRNAAWASGDSLDAATVRQSLQQAILALEGTSLGLDLAQVAEIRVMATRVLEVRLRSPMPEFLQLLAQPELGLLRDNQGIGPMVRDVGETSIRLRPIAPQLRGLPERRGWEDGVLDVVLRGMPAGRAVEAFRDGENELVLNGRLSTLPLADVGPLSGGTLRLDTPAGMFGLAFRNTRGMLATAARREALSMAINRETLLQPFNLAGWEATTRIVPRSVLNDENGSQSRWADQTFKGRQATAAGRISAWKRESGEEAQLTIALPEGPGSRLLLGRLASDFASIGVELKRADTGQPADLELVDRLARYAAPRWFLNQFNCVVAQPICSGDADALVDDSLYALSAEGTEALLLQAEAALLAEEPYIPLGAPLRWSLVRGSVEGFAENRWGRHPLYPLATAPIS